MNGDPKPGSLPLGTTQDQDYLRLLSIFHFVVGGLAALFALFPLIHLIMGIIMIAAPEKLVGRGEPPPPFIGWLFVIFALLFIGAGWVFAASMVTAGVFMARRKHYLFCLVMGGVECIFMPFGTVLGVFTIVVLMRESVKPLFASTPLAVGHSPPRLR